MPLYDYKCPKCGAKAEILILQDGTTLILDEETSDIVTNLCLEYDIYCKKCLVPAERMPSKFGKHLSWSKWNV